MSVCLVFEFQTGEDFAKRKLGAELFEKKFKVPEFIAVFPDGRTIEN